MSVLLPPLHHEILIIIQGPAGRRSQPADATKEDFFSYILNSNEVAHADSSRTRRETRLSRERVSHQGPYPLIIPAVDLILRGFRLRSLNRAHQRMAG